jgi:RNA polymerase sigma-70 factor (ECF subfamily)
MQGVGPTDEVRETAVAHAFAAFYREHYGAVLAFAVRRIDDRETAREIAVDVFRIAWGAFGSGPAPSRAWLLRVARNQVGDAYRRRDRDHRLRSALEGEAVLDRGDPPDERVREVLDTLPEATREVLMLTYWDGLPAAEVGRQLGCSTAAVWVRLHRARAVFAAAWTEAS